jgi:hypothetical protein
MPCYHMVSCDLSIRQHEILKLRIKYCVFKSDGDCQYAEVLVDGKTGTRPIRLINSIALLKDYLNNEHLQSGNLNTPLICSTGKSIGR